MTKLKSNFIELAIENFNLTPIENEVYQATLNNCPVFIQSERDIMRFTVLGDLFECSKIDSTVYIILFLWNDWIESKNINIEDVIFLKIPKIYWNNLFDNRVLIKLKDFQQKAISLNNDKFIEESFRLKRYWKNNTKNIIEYKQKTIKNNKNEIARIKFKCAIRNSMLQEYFIPKYRVKLVIK